MDGDGIDIARERARAQARRAYEWGRLRVALGHAGFAATLVGVAAWALVGPAGLAWLPLTFVAWAVAFWRGGALLQGARYGLVGGLLTYLLPLSLLRPCCQPSAMGAMGECCTMPGMCVLVGAALGLSLAWFLPRGPGARRIEAATGMALGMTSVAALKCSALFLGEAVGLVGGLLAGVTVAGIAAAVLDRRARAAA